MKKIWLYAAAMAAVTACSEAAVEELTPEVGGKLVTITADAVGTRVAVDHDDWSATWESGDAMAAINTKNDVYGAIQEFTLTSGEGTAVGDFTGEANGTCCFVYPYSAADVRRGDLLIDITQQQEGMTNCFMMALNVNTSEPNPTMTMQHATGVYELNMTSLPDCDNYTIDRVEVIGLFGKLALSNSGGIEGNKRLPITITDGVTKVAKGTATIRFNAMVSPCKSLTVVAYLENGTYKKAVSQTLTASSAVDFGVGEHHTINCSNMVLLDGWGSHKAGDITDGTISSAEELAKLASMVNSKGDDDGYDGDTFTLTQDIDLSEYEWATIGTSDNPFKGTFDGDGHKITGLYINQPDKQYQGLFGKIYGGTIKNLSVSGYVVGLNYVSGVVGQASNGATIDNCHNLCTVRATDKGSYIGGVVASMIGETSKLTGCSNSGDVTGLCSMKIGGVVGVATCAIVNCYNLGAVTNSNSTLGKEVYVGGVAGAAYKGVKNCYNRGYVANSLNTYVDYFDNHDIYVGGVAGYGKDYTANNCYNSGIVTNSGRGANVYIGSVAGDAIITNCYFQTGTADEGKGNGSGTPTSYTNVEMTDGTLLNALNTNRTSITDAQEWEVGINSYPTLKK